jgi:hypothetical protein
LLDLKLGEPSRRFLTLVFEIGVAGRLVADTIVNAPRIGVRFPLGIGSATRLKWRSLRIRA